MQRGESGRRRATHRPPCPCSRTTTGRIFVIIVKPHQNRSQKGPQNEPKMDPNVNTNNVQNDFQPHTSPLTRTHTVKLPVRCDYLSFFSATRNFKRMCSIDHSIVCLKSSFASLFEFGTYFDITHNIDQSTLNVHRCTNCVSLFYFRN